MYSFTQCSNSFHRAQLYRVCALKIFCKVSVWWIWVFFFPTLAWGMCCIVESVCLCDCALFIAQFIYFFYFSVCVCDSRDLSLHFFVLYRWVDTTDTEWTWKRRQYCHFEFMVPPQIPFFCAKERCWMNEWKASLCASVCAKLGLCIWGSSIEFSLFSLQEFI